jgi:CRISPR type IV-associated protein Csf2
VAQTADMSSYRFEGLARALSAISHLGESAGGTVSVFRREKVCSQGQVIEVPVISGNAFRGQLRDTGMRYMLRELGDPVLSPAAFHFLTSGGALSKDAGRGLDIGAARRLRELIPLVGVFGGACGRQILEGKLQVGKWYPICQELREFLPPHYQTLPAAQQISIYELTDVHSFTRTDDAKAERWQKYLQEEQRSRLEAPKVKAAQDGTEIAEKPGTAQQMRYSQEVLVAGTTFYCWLALQDVTSLEFEAFASALVEWSKAPFIGGQSRHGCGEVELHFENWISISPLARLHDQEVGRPLGHAYGKHLHEQKDAILQALQEIG